MNKVEVRRPCGGWKTEGIFSFFNFKRRTCHITFKGEHDLMVCLTLEPRDLRWFAHEMMKLGGKESKCHIRNANHLGLIPPKLDYIGYLVLLVLLWDYFGLKIRSRAIDFMYLTSDQLNPNSVAQNCLSELTFIKYITQSNKMYWLLKSILPVWFICN